MKKTLIILSVIHSFYCGAMNYEVEYNNDIKFENSNFLSQNSFNDQSSFMLNMYDEGVIFSNNTEEIPPPPPSDGSGGYTPGAPTAIISMYLPLLFLLGIYLIYKNKTKLN
jgi:hypothetical protein